MAVKIIKLSRYPKQSGVTLLIIMLLLVVASSYALLRGLSAAARRAGDYQATMQSLNQAKQALISYAVAYYDLYSAGDFGILPCPDTSSSGQEGNQDATCGSRNVNSLGMLPWQTLGLSPLKDAAGQCLWYAVSGPFKGGGTKAYMVNEDSRGTFQIYASDGSSIVAGSTATSRPVAVIFAPGSALSYQNRTPTTGTICGNDYTASHFLDAQVPSNPSSGITNYSLSATADAIDRFIQTSNPTIDTVNDLMVYITADEIFNAIKKRGDYDDKLYNSATASNLTRSVALCIANYGKNHNNGANYSLPYPAPLALSDYRVDSNYDDMSSSSNLLSGRVPNTVDSSNSIIGDSSPQSSLITGCSTFTSSSELMELWKNWKDHLFYAVGDAYKPQANYYWNGFAWVGNNTALCGNGVRCITISRTYGSNNTRDYAAIVTFSNSVIGSQSRNAPPIDTGTDEKAVRTNYRENLVGSNNTTDYANTAGDDTKRYDYYTASATTFNDISYCINDDDSNDATYEPSRLAVVECPKDCNPSQGTTCP